MRAARFQALVTQHPGNEMFRFSLGKALLDEDRAAEAVAHFQFCAEHKADWMMARILWGQALLAAGEKDRAAPILREALRLAIEQNHEAPEAELRALLETLGTQT